MISFLPGNKQVVPPAPNRTPDTHPDGRCLTCHMCEFTRSAQAAHGDPVQAHRPYHSRRRHQGPQAASPGHGHRHLPHLAAGLSRWLNHEPRTLVPATHSRAPLRVTPKRGLSAACSAGQNTSYRLRTPQEASAPGLLPRRCIPEGCGWGSPTPTGHTCMYVCVCVCVGRLPYG